ncbi:inositol monophosphatase family protein [Ignavibacteria bacterium]|nr:inositol monophosphatase [Bacteroidota bacterium]MCZ2133218.1 inositol monophosphatase [Bacteroidota bacterium]
MNNTELLATARNLAVSAGELLRKGFGGSFGVSSKEGRHNLVTEYDNRSEDLIISGIRRKFPDHEFLAEESGASGNTDSNVRWIIDPLDGTVNFAHSIPIFCVSIAAEVGGEIECGVIYQPMTDEMFTTIKDGGAFLNDKPLRVSQNTKLNDAILVTGFPYNVGSNPDNCIEHFSAFLRFGIPIRRLGSAALDLAYTAAGRFDGFWEARLNPWDVAAGMLMVREAGGRISSYDNSEYKIGDKSIVASNGHIHGEILDVLYSVR